MEKTFAQRYKHIQKKREALIQLAVSLRDDLNEQIDGISIELSELSDEQYKNSPLCELDYMSDELEDFQIHVVHGPCLNNF